MLELRILGQFEVRVDGEPIEIASRPAQSLFAYLCFHPHLQHRREKLAGMLWPDSDESNARSNLRHALWRLGEVVGKASFVADKLSISINPEADLWIDVAQFETTSEDDPLDDVLAAVQLYRGELLPGFYEDWVELERERLRAAYDRKVERLISLLLDAGRWAAAIQWSERWIAQGHVPEYAFRSLMVAHRALGDSAKVASTYERCKAALREDLDVEPSPETTTLFKELTSPSISQTTVWHGTPELSPKDGGHWKPPAGTAKPSWLDEGDLDAFVGRDMQLAELDRMLETCLLGRGQMAMIVGEAGSGKTTLATVFCRRVASLQPQLKLAMGRCDLYTGAGNPYAPFQDVLGTLLAEDDGVAGSSVLSAEAWLQQRLTTFGPDLLGTMIPQDRLSRPRAVSGPERSTWTESFGLAVETLTEVESASMLHRNRVLEAYADIFIEYSQRRPLLIVLDDLHWIDPSSASLLRYLTRVIEESPIFVVGTYRPDEMSSAPDGAAHPLADVLPDIKRTFGDVWLDVEQSDSRQAQLFVDQLLEKQSVDAGQDFRRTLAETTRGHPFFVLELVRDLQERGGLVDAGGGRWVEAEGFNLSVLPTRVEAVVEDRVGRLDAELREAVNIASVQGDEFIAEVVAEVQGVDPAALVRRLTEELGRRHRLVDELGIERVHGQLLTRFAFRHMLIQKYLYQRLGRGERAYLHEATGRCLQRLYQSSDYPPANQLARHFIEAGLAEEAASYLQLAGEQALRVSAYPEAIAHLMQARELLPPRRVEAGDDERVVSARQERLLGEAHYGLGDLSESASLFESAVHLLGQAVPRGTWRVATGLAGEVLVQALHLVFGSRRPSELLREKEHFHESAVTYKLLAEIYLVRNETLKTLYATVRGLNLSERSGSAVDLARAYADSTVVAPLLRLRRLGEYYRRRALEHAELSTGERARPYVDLSTSIYTLGEGNWSDALASLESANLAHERAGDWNRLGVGLMLLANYHSLRGEHGESLATYLQLCGLAERSGNTQHLAWGIDGRAKCLLRRRNEGDVELAVELLSRSVEMLQGEGMHQEEVEAMAFLAFAQWTLGRPEQALSTARRASSILGRSAPNFFSQVDGYASVVRTYLYAWGRQADRGEAVEDLRTQARHAVKSLDRLASVFPVCQPRAAIWHASLDWMNGRHRAARNGWQKALAQAVALEMPYEEAMAHLELGRHLPEGSQERDQHLQQAGELFERQSAAGELAAVRGAEA